MTENFNTPTHTTTASEDTSRSLTLDVDLLAFMQFLDGTDWSEEQKGIYLAQVWAIVCEFVALGYGVHPVQQVHETCGQHSKNDGDTPLLGPDVLQWICPDLENAFENVADADSRPAAERIQE